MAWSNCDNCEYMFPEAPSFAECVKRKRSCPKCGFNNELREHEIEAIAEDVYDRLMKCEDTISILRNQMIQLNTERRLERKKCLTREG